MKSNEWEVMSLEGCKLLEKKRLNNCYQQLLRRISSDVVYILRRLESYTTIRGKNQDIKKENRHVFWLITARFPSERRYIMSKTNNTRSGCRDVFHSFLVSDATYDGVLEIPVIQPTDQLPNFLISFSKAMRTDDYDQWVHFYEDDGSFERVWNRPNYYLSQLKKFNGVITPDFSLYRDMPLVMQQWNTYRGKALGHWWQTQGMHVLPNVRTGDERSFAFSCCGVPHNAPICIGTHGCLKIRKDRELFMAGLSYVLDELVPSHIIFYGAVPEAVMEICSARKVKVLQFPSEFALSRKGVSA